MNLYWDHLQNKVDITTKDGFETSRKACNQEKEIKWLTVRPQIGPEYYRGYIGTINICVISLSIVRTENYKVKYLLPDLESDEVSTVEQGKSIANETLNRWLKKADLI